jgi:tritrans,polycis-undecaprenyl-diphosphate synthase [geranylgeranyl-diphosphate specific]
MWRILPELLYKGYEFFLEKNIRNSKLPQHIAIIMDGNRRYAKKLGKFTSYGHTRGADITEKVIEWSYESGIKELTIYAFSTENFSRKKDEKKSILKLIGTRLEEMCVDERTHKRRLKVRIIGDRTLLPGDLLQSIDKVEMATKDYDRLKLNIAIAYGGRQDIIQAIREVARKIKTGDIKTDEITEKTISRHLYPEENSPVSNVDLIIRTGGNERVSNFLPWQACGNECAAYFCAPYWPDFRKIDFLRSIRTYQQRQEERSRTLSNRTLHFIHNIERKLDVRDVDAQPKKLPEKNS